ncbi:SGNH/GDSL hydrolase family protein [Sphingobacterium faecale]|uniref:SGNH/GDSL hydrolase family protein n=1 Tax=Sphingobacterium faecale TaxID=2803775 RepID=A0ABS1R1I4_9SPHI|nr:SGNH/GDSL hydrolase family protein [Sphingobacterium faecale]MBL1408561.1 SGNH/GDSL hydrolase family protein [Sphingobacterium faecale]
MKRLTILLIAICLSIMAVQAQGKKNVFHTLPIYGKYFDTPEQFHRVDTLRYGNMPKNVKNLYTNSAGMFVTFRSNTSELYARWCVTDRKVGLNLTAIANKGLDVYIKNEKGKWQYAGSKGTVKTCEETLVLENLDSKEKEFLVYLPLYDETKSLEIGIDEDASFQPLTNPFKRNIIIYGSSIVHGASASRPGMAYPAILSRRTGYNFINFGISGNARMEKEVVHMLADANPDMFILDCVPNSSPEQVTDRTSYIVTYLREKHPNTPIVMIPSVIRELSYFNQNWNKRNHLQNANWKAEYNKLIAKGIKALYYLDNSSLLGEDHEATTDGTHPNDLGFMRMVEQIEPFVLDVLKKHNIH